MGAAILILWQSWKLVGGHLGPQAVRVSGTAETEYASGKPAVWPPVLSDLSICSS